MRGAANHPARERAGAGTSSRSVNLISPSAPVTTRGTGAGDAARPDIDTVLSRAPIRPIEQDNWFTRFVDSEKSVFALAVFLGVLGLILPPLFGV
jgi:hypothetical protein